MQLEPRITFRGVKHSMALETDIRRRLDKLETYYPRVTDCAVLVELPQRHHGAGNRFHVRIDLTVPGEEIVVAHDGDLHATAKDVQAERLSKSSESDPGRKHARVAVREAFEIARRRLQDYARRQRGAIKTTAKQARGHVSQVFPVDQYGYIEAADGRDVYFQRSSVLNDAFARLEVGSAVSFVEEPGEKGPQASSVKLLHAHRVHRASLPTARTLS